MRVVPILLPALLSLSLKAAQDSETPLFRAGVSLVRVDAQVVSRQGRTITGLGKDDFLVKEDGRPRTVQYFGRESEPLDLLLLLDVSGSMSRSLEELARVARGALGQLKADDRVSVILFARKAVVAEEFTSDLGKVEAEIRGAVKEKGLGSGTLINASILRAALEMRRQPRRGRRAILIVTDNRGLNYQTPDEEILKALSDADTVLNAIVVGGERPKPPKPGQYVNPDFTPSNVYKLAEHSGGESADSGKAGDLFLQMMERIRSRYSLQYAAPEGQAGTYRELRVELTAEGRRRHPDAVVRARSGYYVGY